MHIHELSNNEIMLRLNKLVYGHKEAKISLINMLRRSNFNYYNNHILRTGKEVQNKNILLVGESGTGKTHLIKSLQKIVEFPLLTFDATHFAPVGAKGTDTPKIIATINATITELLKQPGYFSREGVACQLVVFIDEIDKIAKAYDSSGHWNTQIQSMLLTLIDGDIFPNISFVFAGAFSLTDFRAKASIKPKIGFFSNDEPKPMDDSLDAKIIEYGLMTELVGRIDSIVQLDELTYKELRPILFNKIIPEKVQELEMLGVVAPSFNLETIVNNAIISKCGVRGLIKEVNRVCEAVEFNVEEVSDDLSSETEQNGGCFR